MRLGLALPHYDTSLAGRPASWAGIKEAAVTAERAGFDSVWVSDHLFLDWSKYGGPAAPQGSFECWTTMSALAAVTDRVRVGSLVLCNDLRNPALLAKMTATLDLLSGGRVEVGLGAGWYEPEYAAAGLNLDAAPKRIDRMGEAVEIVVRLLGGEEVSYEGEHYQLSGAICRPRPAQDPRPAVWVGGKGNRTLRTAARVADGWNFSWMSDVAAYEERADFADKACADEGRDPATLKRSVGAYVLAGSNDADLRRRFERLVATTPPGVLRSSSGVGEVSLDEFRQRSVVGTVDEVIDELARLKEMGVEEVIVGLGAVPFQVADLEDIEMTGTQIGPALR